MIICTGLFFFIYFTLADGQKRDADRHKTCLTGYMTDVQSWVNEYGSLSNTTDIKLVSLDLSGRINSSRNLERVIIGSNIRKIKYFSLARCRLIGVPFVFNIVIRSNRKLRETVEYVSFYGNKFEMAHSYKNMYDVRINASDTREIRDLNFRRQVTVWSIGFHGIMFPNLKELDLRSCSIQTLRNNTFVGMPRLESLYLGENGIQYIEANTFNSMAALKHLDLSHNYDVDPFAPQEITFDDLNLFSGINLESLDLSYTKMGLRNINLIKSVEHSVVRMSLCYSGLNNMKDDVFNFEHLKYLDVSGNVEMLSSPNFLKSFEKTLEVLYAQEVGIRKLTGLENFSRLEILKLNSNEINTIPQNIASGLKKLQILDLSNNRMTTLTNNIFSKMKHLKLLLVQNNHINIITNETYEDMKHLTYIGLYGNPLICNCYIKQVFEVGLKNELKQHTRFIYSTSNENDQNTLFHSGFQDYNNIIRRRRNLTDVCNDNRQCKMESSPEILGNYLFIDSNDKNNEYQCLSVYNARYVSIMATELCSLHANELGIRNTIQDGWNKLSLLIIPAVLLPILLCVFRCKKNIRYFLITIKNSATMSLISKDMDFYDGTIFNYDVFVSYCNEDRAWVLDQLLPHVEKDCNISVCLHERDFQVGLSILENIVSCMDRSRTIMLIISKKFLLSQWCQFEMHLAQHRLLETRREDLILVLLEEVPRRSRPNTLQYLMLTKTYIVWPKDKSEEVLFWKRMKKSLVTQVMKNKENVSLA